MNWILDTYSNVYKTAMMQEQNTLHHVASAKGSANAKRQGFLGFFGRR